MNIILVVIPGLVAVLGAPVPAFGPPVPTTSDVQASTAAPTDPVPANAGPTWVRPPRVTVDDYPRRAIDRGVSGLAAITCKPSADGRPTSCRIVTETPAGLGFGAAALRVVERARLTPLGANDDPEAVFTVTIRFPLG